MMKFSLLLLVASLAAVFSNANPSENNSITDEFIREINSAQRTWLAGHNFPQNTSFSKLKVLCGTVSKIRPPVKHIVIPDNFKIPKTFDSRRHWPHCKSLREIKNQGHCGSCWAVSSAQIMSDRLCIESKGKFNRDLSAQHIVSCSTGQGCNGGFPSDAWGHFITNGIPTGGDFHSKQGCQPYLLPPCINRTGEDGKPAQCPSRGYVHTPACRRSRCYNSKYHVPFARDRHFGRAVYSMSSDVKQIQMEIITKGPVVAVFHVFEDFFTYKRGVYHYTYGSLVGLHSIRIIGWGTLNGEAYWLLTNQWGAEWGNKGVIKIRRGTNECDIEGLITAGTIKK